MKRLLRYVADDESPGRRTAGATDSVCGNFGCGLNTNAR
jgi:hypothetical protein